jgi:MFS family permease
MTSHPRHVARTYLLVSALDYFADMTLAVTSVLLLQSKGLSGPAIFATVAGVWLVEGLFEVPTGILADMLGRRLSVLISFVMRAIGYSALFFFDSAAVAVAGTLFAAVGTTFYSGSMEAWAVDELGDSAGKNLDQLFTRSRVAENAGLFLGTMVGAALGMLNLAWPQLLAGSTCAIGAGVCALLMTEHHKPASRPEPGTLRAQVRTSLHEVVGGTRRTLRGDKVLVSLILGAALLWLFRGIPGVQWTASFEQTAGGSLLVLGWMRSGSTLLEIPLLMGVMRFQHRSRGLRQWIITGAAIGGAVFLTLAALAESAAVRIGAYVCFSLAIGVCMPGIRAAINERIAPQHRATALSVASLFNSLFTGLGLIVVGSTVPDLSSVSTSWPLAALGFALVGVLVGVLVSLPRPRAQVIEAEQAPPGLPVALGGNVPLSGAGD